jgi:hypothetical protein
VPAGWPYPPCSRNLNSARSTSRRTREAVNLHLPFCTRFSDYRAPRAGRDLVSGEPGCR